MRSLHTTRADAPACWEHFSHQADIGVRGFGSTMAEAFEQTALAMTAVITPPEEIRCLRRVSIHCQAPDAELLLADWLNALIYEMADHNLLFGRFAVSITDEVLTGEAWGEPVDRGRHQPVVEIKGATFTELKVGRQPDGRAWFAQAVLDV
jgi:SHS2 domain-containing protein